VGEKVLNSSGRPNFGCPYCVQHVDWHCDEHDLVLEDYAGEGVHMPLMWLIPCSQYEAVQIYYLDGTCLA